MPSHLLSPEVPAFANTDDPFGLLRAKGVVVNAKPADQGPSWFESLLSALLPTLLIVVVMVWLLQRLAGAGAGGPLGGFGRSRARRVEPSAERVTFDDIAGIASICSRLPFAFGRADGPCCGR